MSILIFLSQDFTKVTSFFFMDDRKRAFLSIMLQHSLTRFHLKASDSDFVIERTPEAREFVLVFRQHLSPSP
jgi:hypothetical protein